MATTIEGAIIHAKIHLGMEGCCCPARDVACPGCPQHAGPDAVPCPTCGAPAEVRALREALDMTANLVHGRHFHIDGLNVPFAECSSLICVGAQRALAPEPPEA